MGCLHCGEKYYNYVGVDEDGEDLIECLGCQRIQHFAATPEDGIVEVEDGVHGIDGNIGDIGVNDDDSEAGFDDGIDHSTGEILSWNTGSLVIPPDDPLWDIPF